MVEICKTCNGVIYPFERANMCSCLCVPTDYEQCADCGYDHEYDQIDAYRAHALLIQAQQESSNEVDNGNR